MNLIAIGILGLLAFSLIISSKHFRVFVGSMIVVLAALGLAAFAVLGLQPEIDVRRPESKTTESSQVARLKRGLRRLIKPNVRDTVEATSELILEAVTHGDHAEEDPIDKIVAESEPAGSAESEQIATPSTAPLNSAKTIVTQSPTLILVPESGNKMQDQISLAERISQAVDKHLDWYRKQCQARGVDRLQARHLDLNEFLKWHVRRVGDKNQLYASLTFDEAFNQHVQERGLDLVKHYRLKRTVYASAWTLGTMTVVFGLLKFRRTRRRVVPAGDHLLTSGVSMV